MNEYVIYKKDKRPIIYEVIEKKEEKLFLKGVNYRVELTAKIDEIEKANTKILNLEQEKNNKYINININRRGKKYILGTVLHIDADKEYLERCLQLYKDVGIHAYSILYEEDFSNSVKKIKQSINPDTIVITGHDYYNNEDLKSLNNYTNTKKFISAMLELKKVFPNSVYIVGACQSNFEALIASGANFASSPKRINVHIYDPAIIAIKVSTTACDNVVDFLSLSNLIENLTDAFGGVQTKGKMRILY